MKKELELYIHIPFCVKKCAYCDFLSGPADEMTMERYVVALEEEIRAYGNDKLSGHSVITTIFIGGGTPSILKGEQIERIMSAVRGTFRVTENAEVTIEANPGTIRKWKLASYRNAGINRISLGLQSTDNSALKLLGRIHTYEEFLESYQMARECGFDNINVDLISAIPKQSLCDWKRDLRKIVALKPEHISAYSLIVEEGTPFAKVYGEGMEGEKDLPSEEDERMMYQQTEEILGAAGYHRYEISNYAKDGKECRHNLGYWERKNYLGLGLGASSLIDNVRFKNTDDFGTYIKVAASPTGLRKEIEKLSKEEQMEETIFLGLRKMQGISKKKFQETFQKTLEECYGENIERMTKEGLVETEAGFLRLTRKGIDISNYVFARILV